MKWLLRAAALLAALAALAKAQDKAGMRSAASLRRRGPLSAG